MSSDDGSGLETQLGQFKSAFDKIFGNVIVLYAFLATLVVLRLARTFYPLVVKKFQSVPNKVVVPWPDLPDVEATTKKGEEGTNEATTKKMEKEGNKATLTKGNFLVQILPCLSPARQLHMTRVRGEKRELVESF